MTTRCTCTPDSTTQPGTYCPMHGCPHNDAGQCDCLRAGPAQTPEPGPRLFTGPTDVVGVPITRDPVTGHIYARIPSASGYAVGGMVGSADPLGVADAIDSWANTKRDVTVEVGPPLDDIATMDDLKDHPLESLLSAIEAHVPTSKRAREILATAAGLVDGDRNSAYGDARDNFTETAALWSPVLGVEVTAEQVALCMAQVKIARLIHNPTHADSWVDGVGYLGLGGGIAQQTAEESA